MIPLSINALFWDRNFTGEFDKFQEIAQTCPIYYSNNAIYHDLVFGKWSTLQLTKKDYLFIYEKRSGYYQTQFKVGDASLKIDIEKRDQKHYEFFIGWMPIYKKEGSRTPQKIKPVEINHSTTR